VKHDFTRRRQVGAGGLSMHGIEGLDLISILQRFEGVGGCLVCVEFRASSDGWRLGVRNIVFGNPWLVRIRDTTHLVCAEEVEAIVGVAAVCGKYAYPNRRPDVSISVGVHTSTQQFF
jgi:hypothetical protein